MVAAATSLPLLGALTREGYFDKLGIPVGNYAYTYEWIASRGLLLAVTRVAELVSPAASHPWLTAIIAAIGIGLYLAMRWVFLTAIDEVKDLQRASPRLMALVQLVSVAPLATWLTLYVVSVALILVALPPSNAYVFGKEEARHDLSQFEKGCGVNKEERPCVEIWEAGEHVATGFIVASSPTIFALYDVDLGGIREFQRGDKEVRTAIRFHMSKGTSSHA